METIDHGIRFAYRAAFVTGALERFICGLAPDLAQPPFCQPIVP
jgi:hypothetical protein